MSAYKHILIATSLADDNEMILERAASMAKHTGAKLSIVHVIEFNPMMYGGGEFAIPLDGDLEKSIHRNAEKALTATANKLSIPADRQHLQSGITVEHLSELVNKIKADLLLMGHHDRHWLQAMLGSTSNSLVHIMPCDVLAVHL